MNSVKIKNVTPKTYVLELVQTILKKCDEDIRAYKEKINEDFLHYFVVNTKSHVICAMMKEQLEELRSWIETEADDEKIVELLESGVSFMSKKLLEYRRPQSTNELHNLKEEYKLEMYSTLITTYQQMVNRTRSYMTQNNSME